MSLWQTHGATRDDKTGATATLCLQWMIIHMIIARSLWSSYARHSAFIEETEGKYSPGLSRRRHCIPGKNAFYKFTRLEWIRINHVMPTKIDTDHFFITHLRMGRFGQVLSRSALEISQRYLLFALVKCTKFLFKHVCLVDFCYFTR